eukprot:jgi/Mesvir1/1548/Mv14531-RA.2
MTSFTVACRALVALLLVTCVHVSANEMFVKRTDYPEGVSVEMSNMPFPGAVKEEVGNQADGGLFPWSGPFGFLLGSSVEADVDDDIGENDGFPSPASPFSIPSLFGGNFLRGLLPSFWSGRDEMVRDRESPSFVNVRALNLGRMMAPGGMMRMGGPGGMMMGGPGGMMRMGGPDGMMMGGPMGLMMSGQERPQPRSGFWNDLDEEQQLREVAAEVAEENRAGAQVDGEDDASSGYDDEYDSDAMEAIEEMEAQRDEEDEQGLARREMRMVPMDGVPVVRVYVEDKGERVDGQGQGESDQGQAEASQGDVSSSSSSSSLSSLVSSFHLGSGRPLEQVLQVVEERLPVWVAQGKAEWLGGEGKPEPIQVAERPEPEGRPESMESAERPQAQSGVLAGGELAPYAEATPDMELTHPAVDPQSAFSQAMNALASLPQAVEAQMAGVAHEATEDMATENKAEVDEGRQVAAPLLREVAIEMEKPASWEVELGVQSREEGSENGNKEQVAGSWPQEEGLSEMVGTMMEVMREMVFDESSRPGQRGAGELAVEMMRELEPASFTGEYPQDVSQEENPVQPQDEAQVQEVGGEPQSVAIPDDRRMMMGMRERVMRPMMMRMQQEGQEAEPRTVPKQHAAEAYAWEAKRMQGVARGGGWDYDDEDLSASSSSSSESSSASSDEGSGMSRLRSVLHKMAHCPVLRTIQVVALVGVLAATTVYLLRRHAAASAPAVTVVALCPDMENPLLHTYKTSQGHQGRPAEFEVYGDKDEVVYQYRPPVLPEDRPLPGMMGN